MDAYDIVIIGSGPAGMSAALYAARSGYKTLVIEKMGPGGQMMLTDIIDNYPGFPEGISGFDLQDRMYKQALKFGMEMVTHTVSEIIQKKGTFEIVTESLHYTASAIIIATGAQHRLLGTEGESRLGGKGVSYCGTCDGPFYRGKEVVVIGGGDSALTETLFIAKFAKHITLIHRKERFRAVNSLIEEIEKLPNVSAMMESVVEEIQGENQVTSVKVKHLADNTAETLKTDGVFIFVGLTPNTSFVNKTLLDQQGYINTDEQMKTGIPGIFAAGDVRSGTFRQVICAAADGAKAAQYAGEYIDELKGQAYR